MAANHTEPVFLRSGVKEGTLVPRRLVGDVEGDVGDDVARRFGLPWLIASTGAERARHQRHGQILAFQRAYLHVPHRSG